MVPRRSKLSDLPSDRALPAEDGGPSFQFGSSEVGEHPTDLLSREYALESLVLALALHQVPALIEYERAGRFVLHEPCDLERPLVGS